ncbi:hypothetical protein DDB_G0286749 [Dictyostelium discoideum AX4]|uniref:Major facilitator superfamily (MFS) profile domain-containing protein n=1 Tax=Dictyostelium discoideum TaxID=44689 RepID=Q54LA4_DICDI|nr:hypothetical protein DDB_G0286749 [Dictyostelium discoideum AX4]EAL64130.1 hypothetical protein DDB_G0286749 [Dictyostelium discoideum AX4]|eukprot:XP_637657.1 hypothetical protein DDB_G0286749 [Dictyostelium discoideum AX4]
MINIYQSNNSISNSSADENEELSFSENEDNNIIINGENNNLIKNSHQSSSSSNLMFSGSENYMIVSRVLSDNSLFIMENDIENKDNIINNNKNNNSNNNVNIETYDKIDTPGNDINGDKEINDINIPDENERNSPSNTSPLLSSSSSQPQQPQQQPNYKGYTNLTPTHSDSEDSYDEIDTYDNMYIEQLKHSKPINIRNSSDDFETIEIKTEFKDNNNYDDYDDEQLNDNSNNNNNNNNNNTIHNNNNNLNSISSNSISPPTVSPFKILLTNKLKSIKDKIENSPNSDKYNTFPMDRYNNIPSSDISLFSSSPAYDIVVLNTNQSLTLTTTSTTSNNCNNSNNNNNNNGNHSNSNSIGSNSSLNSGINSILSTSSMTPSNSSHFHDNNNKNNITTDGESETSFETDSQISSKALDGAGGETIFDTPHHNHHHNHHHHSHHIIHHELHQNPNGKTILYSNPNLIRYNSNSSITRPVLSYERTKLNYKILSLLSLSVFFSVSNLYYAQPLLNEFVKEFNISNSVASLITMAVQLGYALGLSLISILGDSMSKKKLTLVLSLITCGSLFGIATSPHIISVIIFHFIVGASTIIPYIAIPLAMDMTNPSDRSSIVGVLLSSVFVGLLGARVLSGVIGYLFGWRTVFYFAGVTMFIISSLLFYFLPYTPRNQNTMPYNKLLISVYEFLKKEKVLRQTCFIGSMVFSTFSILWTTLSFRLNEEPYEYPCAFIGLFGLIGMAGAISSPLSGRLAERFGINRLMIVYLLICAVGYLILMFFDYHIIGLIVGIFILDLGVQSCHISNQSRNNLLSSSLQDDTSKYNINTIYMASYFIGGSIGSGLSGVIFAHFGWAGSSIVALLFLSLGLICHLITYEKPTFISVPIED